MSIRIDWSIIILEMVEQMDPDSQIIGIALGGQPSMNNVVVHSPLATCVDLQVSDNIGENNS